jgi:hypothetical protein
MPVIPVFVWVVLSLAILILATGVAVNIAAYPILDSLNGGFGYAVVIAIVMVMWTAIWIKKRN